MRRVGSPHAPTARAVLAAVFSSIALLAVPDVSADSDLDRLEAMWKRGDYARVTRELIDYRERTGSRTPQLDYMIATSACRTADRRPLGNEFFAWILQNYNLSPASRTQVESQRQLCSAGGAPERFTVTAPAAIVGVAYHGKGGTGYEAEPAGNGTTTLIAAIPPEQFAQRLFAPSDAKRAALSIANLLPPEFEVEAVGHFVLASPPLVPRHSPGILNAAARPAAGESSQSAVENRSGMPNLDAGTLLKGGPPNLPTPPYPLASKSIAQSARQEPRDMVQQMAPASSSSVEDVKGDLKRVGKSLEDYLGFFISEYGMRPPSFLITVYFAEDRTQLGELARKLHGIALAPGSIGYSFPADQSMVGWADGKAYGTFAHELFHMMVRQNFGDIPPFLDEGMAALYEVSGFEGRRAVGAGNWRGAILRKSWAARPSIKDVVQMNRSAFDDIAGPSAQLDAGQNQSVNHATARYLMLYLQQRGELLAVYKAFLNRKVNDRPAAQSVALLESVLGRSLETVDAEFAAWFTALPR
jgi:hypothetical protein